MSGGSVGAAWAFPPPPHALASAAARTIPATQTTRRNQRGSAFIPALCSHAPPTATGPNDRFAPPDRLDVSTHLASPEGVCSERHCEGEDRDCYEDHPELNDTRDD